MAALLGLCEDVGLLLEFFQFGCVSLNLEFDNLDGCISNLIAQKKLVELSKVGESVEHIEEIKSQVQTLLVIVSESSRECS